MFVTRKMFEQMVDAIELLKRQSYNATHMPEQKYSTEETIEITAGEFATAILETIGDGSEIRIKVTHLDNGIPCPIVTVSRGDVEGSATVGPWGVNEMRFTRGVKEAAADMEKTRQAYVDKLIKQVVESEKKEDANDTPN